jgi:hypothetical protein
MANYAFGRIPIPDVKDGHTFRGDNFTQLVPHTKILEGKKELTFINCNLTNCDPPVDSKYEGCQPKHCEFCSNLRPDYVEKYGLKPCAENCFHVVVTDEVTIDSVKVVDAVKTYETKAVA